MENQTAEFLNEHCHCQILDQNFLPQFLSPFPHFLSKNDRRVMANFIQSYHVLLQNENVKNAFISDSIKPSLEIGVFNSFDFHITADGPKLIEINSNAGGALLALTADQNKASCCETDANAQENELSENAIVDMFRSEFARRFPARNLAHIALVDENPEKQFFYPEFVLFQKIMQKNGIKVTICDPQDLSIEQNSVVAQKQSVDFIYNRLTDFNFQTPHSALLKQAYELGLATVSPNPAVYALYANKDNLTKIWDSAFMQNLMVDVGLLSELQKIIPQSLRVNEDNSTLLWRDRKRWFFKPVSSFGGKGAYRGEKLTQKTWERICQDDYLAQAYVPPATRKVDLDQVFKYDIRAFTYGAQILGIVARYYQGQVTNFRTPQGGLASVTSSL